MDTALIGELDQPGLRGMIKRIMLADLELTEIKLSAEETSLRPAAGEPANQT